MGDRRYQVTRSIDAPAAHVWQAPHRMVWSDGMPLGLFVGRRTFTIAETGEQRCDFTMVEALTGPLAWLITKAIPDLTDSFAAFADSLKAAAE